MKQHGRTSKTVPIAPVAILLRAEQMEVWMEELTLRELAVPLIKAIDSFNFLLKAHHRRTAYISYCLGTQLELSPEELIDLVIAASLHDIGALSVQERDTLIQEDVTNPDPHCRMGNRIMTTFKGFRNIAKIIKHHHIRYDEADAITEKILFQSYIIHLADRVDIYLAPDTFILNQKQTVLTKILERKGSIFHPAVCDALVAVAKPDIFWIEINHITMEQLFDKIHFAPLQPLTQEQIRQFALMVSRIVDFRSKFTATHSRTVSRLAAFFGKSLGLNAEECFKLSIAGLFHDVGKIGIDTAYLEKKGPLSAEEYNQVKLHSYYTGEILSDLATTDGFRDIVAWAREHHERLDGQGYPLSLAGDAIPLGARIIAYADVLSALMEDRPYRKGLNVEVTFKVMASNFATAIDPEIFPVLQQHQSEIALLVN